MHDLAPPTESLGMRLQSWSHPYIRTFKITIMAIVLQIKCMSIKFKVTNKVARKELRKVYQRLEKGEVAEVPGLLEQFLLEGKMSEEVACNECVGLFGAGVDTVSHKLLVPMHMQSLPFSLLLLCMVRCHVPCLIKLELTIHFL